MLVAVIQKRLKMVELALQKWQLVLLLARLELHQLQQFRAHRWRMLQQSVRSYKEAHQLEVRLL
jgi:hypothetical protein